MRTPIKHTEPFDQYILDNYQDKSIAEMSRHLNVCEDVCRRVLKKLGIVRWPKTIAKFRGHKNNDNSLDKYFIDNYLKKPLRHICKDLNVSDKVGERIMKRLNLVRPPKLIAHFQGKHTAITDQKLKDKPKVVKAKKVAKIKAKAPKKKLKVDKIPEAPRVLPMRVVNYSQKVMVKIDHKTWVYRDKTA